MDEDEMNRRIEEEIDKAGVIDPGLILALSIMEVLEAREPGFGRAVAERVEAHAKRFEERADVGDAARAKNVREMIEHLFTE